MNLFLNIQLGITLAGLAEAMNLCASAGIDQKDLFKILELSHLCSPIISQEAGAMMEGTFASSMPLEHLQKNLELAVSMGNELHRPLPVAAAASEQFKRAKTLGYGQHDASAVSPDASPTSCSGTPANVPD